MAEEFVMPKLGLTMEAATIVSWLVDDGVEVRPGQAVLVIETDKVESEVEAIGVGRLHRLGEVGQEYPCGAPIAWLLGDGEQPPAPPSSSTGPATSRSPASSNADTAQTAAPATVAATGFGGRVLASPNARRLAGDRGIDLQTVTGTGPGGRITSEDVSGAVFSGAVAATGVGGRVLASPNARRLAGDRGIDLQTVVGTGPGGRITSEDVPAAPAVAAAPAAAPRPTGAQGGARRLATAAARNLADLLGVDLADIAAAGWDPRVTKDDVAAHVRNLLAAGGVEPRQASSPVPALLQEPSRVIPLAGMRGTIAKRMTDSLHSMAQLTLTMDVDMGGVVEDRARRESEVGPAGGAPGFTDYVIAATASALVEHPGVNSQITDDGVALLPQINVGLAVALDEGLIVPVLHDTPALSLEKLAAETSRLAAAARSGALRLPDLEGGTFSVTALGMYGVDGFTPIVNAPNAAILGVGRVRDDVAWSEDGLPVRAPRLTLSLTWDHRAFDGAPAAEFTRTIKTKLEAYGAS